MGFFAQGISVDEAGLVAVWLAFVGDVVLYVECRAILATRFHFVTPHAWFIV